MQRKKVFYPLYLINMVGQLACEVQILRSLFPENKYDINLIVYASSIFDCRNQAVFDNLTRGMNVIRSINPLVVEANHIIRITPDKMGIYETDDGIWVTLPPEKMVQLSIATFGQASWTWHTSLNEQEKSAGRELERLLGIPLGRKIVTIHVRNDEPHGQYFYRYRNANINNYLQTIVYLLDQGYYVVRLGDRWMQRLPIDSPQLIDAPFNPHYSDFFDLYFIAESSFFIGMLSGPCSIAHSFWIPMLYTNTYYCYGQCGYDRGLMIHKKYFSSQLNRYLSYHEILFSPLINYNNMEQFEIAGIELHENSPEEILTATMEMEARLGDRYEANSGFDDSIATIWEQFSCVMNNKKPVGGYDIELMDYVAISHEFIKLNPDFLGHRWSHILTDAHHNIIQ
jgi:putative glycosyltransferase (TIGR04372 family)